MYTVTSHESSLPEDLEVFLAENTSGAFPHYSRGWMEVIARFAGGTPAFLTLERGSKIVGLVPVFIAKIDAFVVANALPLGGSPGSMLLAEGLSQSERESAYRRLFEAIDRWCAERHVDVLTINGNPLVEGEKAFFEACWAYNYYHPKITQINDLSRPRDYKDTIPRNIRKAEKYGVEIVTGYRPDLAEQFYSLYQGNRERYGARVFPPAYFQQVGSVMESRGESEFIYALRDKVLLGALMSLKSRSIACYQEPVVNDAERDSQANSLLLYTLIERHRAKGLRYWSWGASPNRDCGVFKFKAGWGPDVYEYGFYTKIYGSLEALRARGLSGELLRLAAPDYFVVNYDLLK